MKISFFGLLLILTNCMASQPGVAQKQRSNPKSISFRVHNNSVLPHKYVFIGYEPGQVGNWTNSVLLLPGACHRFNCPLGTKIYLADGKQVDVVMGGGSIRNDVPFLTVKAADAGKAFPLHK
ncbi:MAG: hypothetical protein KGS48_09185 [Bacteroidetes bacterium]|nr:hypothetical protein [Bacteroidota bacterium]